MSARNRQTLGIVFVAAIAAFLLALVPTCSQAAPFANQQEYCEVLADTTQIATNARNQGVLLNQFRTLVDRRVDRDNTEMHDMFYMVSRIVYTSDAFANLTPQEAMRLSYRTCMAIRK